MNLSFLPTLACPLCRAPLTLVAGAPDGNGSGPAPATVEEGLLVCTGCGHPYAIRDGIPNMLSPFLPRYEEKMREARGWAELSKAEGWYEPTEAVDLALPNVVEVLGWDPQDASGWLATKHSFEDMMQRFVRPGLRVLEIGAARTWAGRYFVERGCTYAACDIMDDPNIGVGRARFFTQRFGHYEALAADAEFLPFADGSFDLVFAIAALHHALDLRAMVGEMARVTRRGGIVAGLNEGVRSFRAGPDAEIQATEKSYGINEHVYTLWDYLSAFWGSGLRVTRVFRGIGYDWFMADALKARVQQLEAVPVAGPWLAAGLVLGYAHPYDGATFYAVKR